MHHLLYTIAKCLPQICDAQKCTCFLVDDDKDELWAVQGEVNIRLPRTKGIVGAVATTGQVGSFGDGRLFDRPGGPCRESCRGGIPSEPETGEFGRA